MQSDVYDVYCTQASNSVHISTDCKNIKDRKSSVAKERVRMDNSMIRVLNFQPSSGKLTPKTPSQTVRDVLKISGHGQDCQPPKHGSNMDQTWLVYDQLDEQLDAGPLVHQWLEAFPYFTEWCAECMLNSSLRWLARGDVGITELTDVRSFFASCSWGFGIYVYIYIYMYRLYRCLYYHKTVICSTYIDLYSTYGPTYIYIYIHTYDVYIHISHIVPIQYL